MSAKRKEPHPEAKPFCHLCIHGHFYQPPRIDPFTGRIPREPEAAPYANWNERITAECYAPNAEAGNFARTSFNLGGTLVYWLDEQAHATYERIVEAERTYRQSNGFSNALAQPVHHTILPLARRRDKICQVRWGIASFEHRFGHRPQGIWLPEMAVDYETLEILVAEGLRFTILSDEQVQGEMEVHGGPYRVRLPKKAEIAVFVRDRPLSNALSFNMPQPADVSAWMREQLESRRQRDGLVLIATDGETFGHHHRHGVEVLSRVTTLTEDHGCLSTTLERYLHDCPPRADVTIVENSSWSCSHGIERWVTGCGCTAGDTRWKCALRRALDNLANDLDTVYEDETTRLGRHPWKLRDDYLALHMGRVKEPDFLARHDLSHLDGKATRRLLRLLDAQFHRQRMFASCAFFFDDLDRLEPRYAIANAVRALALTRYATGDDLTRGFHRDLRVAVSGRTGRSGADILDQMLEKAEV